MLEQKIIYILYTKTSKELPEEVYNKYLNYLPDSLRDQHFRYRRWQDRTANLLSRMLLIQGLQKFGLDHHSLGNINYTEYKRPYLTGKIDFNISHSGEYNICAIGHEIRVGIDIEEIKPVNFSDFHDLMTTEQWDLIENDRKPLKAFFKFWAIKESIIKADGRGLSIPLNEILITQNIAYFETKWYLTELELDENYCANLASDHENPLINIEYIDFNFL